MTLFFGMSGDLEQLRREASALHRATFGRDIFEEIAQRYADAHCAALFQDSTTESEWMQRVLEKGADLEALEVALRSRQPAHVLCHKFKLLTYIAEAFPEYYIDFVNEERRRAASFFSLAFHGLRTIYKYLKGRWLLRTLV